MSFERSLMYFDIKKRERCCKAEGDLSPRNNLIGIPQKCFSEYIPRTKIVLKVFKDQMYCSGP